jgi:hypothetical protein
MRSLRLAVVALLAMVISGCSAGHVAGGGAGGTIVTVTFVGGTPSAVATQIGTGAFTTATLQSGTLTVNVPGQGVNAKYGIAYVCPPVTGFGNTVTSEFVIEATVSDGTSFTVSCFGPPATASATGSANATAIPGAANILVRGNQNSGGSVGSNNGSFNVNLVTGTNDVAFIAIDNAVQPNVLAVKFVRNQTVPGAVNGGSPVVFVSSDVTTPQSLVVNNVPSGFVVPPAVAVDFMTANGTSVLLDNNSATSYPAVPTASVQSGDFYVYSSNTTDTATKSSVGVTQSTTTGGTSTSLTLPAPWSFSGPTPATLPTFTFTYTGFNGLQAVAQKADIEWPTSSSTSNSIAVTATATFQNGATTITIPSLTVAGFLAPAPSGTTINWVADVFGGSVQSFLASFPANANLSFVQNEGSFIQP